MMRETLLGFANGFDDEGMRGDIARRMRQWALNVAYSSVDPVSAEAEGAPARVVQTLSNYAALIEGMDQAKGLPEDLVEEMHHEVLAALRVARGKVTRTEATDGAGARAALQAIRQATMDTSPGDLSAFALQMSLVPEYAALALASSC